MSEDVMHCAYVTLSDGTLVDIEGNSAAITIRAGMSLTPAERPILLMMTPGEAMTLADNLTAVVKDIGRVKKAIRRHKKKERETP